MGRLIKLLDTTAVRLSLRYSLIYVVILGIAFFVLYWFITDFVEAQVSVSLEREVHKIVSVYSKNGVSGVEQYIDAHERFRGEDHRYYLLVDKGGRVVTGDLRWWPGDIKPGRPVRNIWISEKNIIGKVPDGDGLWPVVAVGLKNGDKVLIAQGIRRLEDLRETLFAVMAVIFASVVVLMLTMGILLGRDVLFHVDRIKGMYNSIVSGDLSKRIPVSSRNDEFDSIGELINSMLDELERLVVQSKEMVDSIAHDIKTPINRMRNRVEGLLQRGNDGCESLSDVVSDVDRIVGMLNALLSISRVESGVLRGNWEMVDITSIVHDVVDFYQPLAEESGIVVEIDVEEGLEVMGNKQLIAQAFGNVMDNAVKYTQSRIGVFAKQCDEKVKLSVCDDGCGVEPEHYDRITQKFVRLDGSRGSGGNGLGLSLVKAVAELHRAELKFAPNNPGLCVSISIPLV